MIKDVKNLKTDYVAAIVPLGLSKKFVQKKYI